MIIEEYIPQNGGPDLPLDCPVWLVGKFVPCLMENRPALGDLEMDNIALFEDIAIHAGDDRDPNLTGIRCLELLLPIIRWFGLLYVRVVVHFYFVVEVHEQGVEYPANSHYGM